MSKENTKIALPDKLMLVSENLNTAVANVMGAENANAFQKAYLIADAIGKLQTILTPEYMKPFMVLQGNKLGFKTDKDNASGYPEAVVKNCLIEAVLFGLQPAGNQFNIIAGQMYATKEGIGYLLSKMKGLSYKIIPELPRIKDGSGAVVMNIEYTINNKTVIEKLDIAIKVNQYMGADAVIGKATRKARKWIYDTITGSEIPEGDVMDIEYKEVKQEDSGDDKKSKLKEGQQGKINLA